MPKKIVEIVLDVETTGLDYTKERMIEFAAVKLVNGEVDDVFETLINPQQHIRKASMAVHHITEEMVADAPCEKEVLPKILKFIGKHPIVAHNAIFDFSFLNEASIRVKKKELHNPRVDTQFLFKEVFPDLESHGLAALLEKLNIEYSTQHRAMADAMNLAKAYPLLKKLYEEKYAWQLKQVENVEYLFERYVRIQQAIQAMQSELQDLKSIFKLYFEQGGNPIRTATGEMLVYQSKQGFEYDFMEIKDILDEIGALGKAVKLNNGFVDRLIAGNALDDATKEKIREARHVFSETRHVHILKPDKRVVSTVSAE